MVNHRKIYELEDDFDRKLRSLKQIEDEVEEYYHKFRMRTNLLIDQIYAVHQSATISPAGNPYLFDLQDNLEMYTREYYLEREQIEEERVQLRRELNRAIDEEYRKKDEE